MYLQLDAIGKTYHPRGATVEALRAIDLQVERGQFVAVRGPSGCGKSTLLLIAGGLLSPTRGRVRIGGTDPYALAPNQRSRFRAKHVGFVFQQCHLVPYLSVMDNVLSPALVGNGGAAAERAVELVKRFHIEHRAGHLPSELSSGERQRAALARAMLNSPSLVLADEPTGNLDDENRDNVIGFLRDIAAKGAAVLLVTHDVQAASMADRVVQFPGTP